MTTKFSKKAFHLVKPFSDTHIDASCRSKKKESGRIQSVNTEHSYMNSITRFLEWIDAMGFSIDDPFSKPMKQEFLNAMTEVYEQIQLDTVRQALELVFKEKLGRVTSVRPTDLLPRSYTGEEVIRIMSHQTDWNALATAICYASGLRAHELGTLEKFIAISQIDGRPWSKNGFAGLPDYQLYFVQGKGGLRRRVAIPIALAIELENRKLDAPWNRVDRKIPYASHYAIGGGKSFSQSFTTASHKALGFSNGAHGLRHSYAKNRLRQLLACGRFSRTECMLILSQELGHFRPEITLVYLR